MSKYNNKIFHDVLRVLCEIMEITADDFLKQRDDCVNPNNYDECVKSIERTSVDVLAKMKSTPMTQYDVAQIREEIRKLCWCVGSIAKELSDHKKIHCSVADCEKVWDDT